MREIIFDTETTGIDPGQGHRLVEIGCVELINLLPSGRTWQSYLNPQRDMPLGAYEVHGLSAEFLADKPLFGDVVDEFLAFVGDARLVAHNAEFDMRFLNAELANIGRPPFPADRVTDTLAMARRAHPGLSASLDTLCRRYGIDLSARTKHGALLDAELLAEVYLELRGGRQRHLELAVDNAVHGAAPDVAGAVPSTRAPRRHAPSDAEKARHDAFLARLKDPIWRRGGQ